MKFFFQLFLCCFFIVFSHSMTKAEKSEEKQQTSEKRKPNHLIGAQSPYLLQHLYNAVDWHPWGEQALKKAKKDNKPIFISVGYSTCHWCHVMARESFENTEIGKYLNEHFISIKIDREQRPDLDNQFMLVTEAMTGTGGWPNSVFLTANAKPFHASTYLPPDQLMNTLKQIVKLWQTEQTTLLEQSEQVANGINRYLNKTEAARNITPEVIVEALQLVTKNQDEFNGGFGVAPKFPQEGALSFLLDQAARGDKNSLDIAMTALDGMIKGGIHDHVGGGFHRYSVDESWLVPHFEKMLYNQALIGKLLVRAYALTGKERYKQTAARLFDYVLRDMQDKNGGFYSAEDAESYNEEGKKKEGAFFIWSQEDITKAQIDNNSVLYKTFPLTENGNFEGKNVLHMQDLPKDIAKSLGLSLTEYYKKLNSGLDKLKQARDKRKHPHKDIKIIVSWNAIMIEALAEASYILERKNYYKAARKAANYIKQNMMKKDDLYRVSFNGNIGIKAQLGDYAGFGLALLALETYALNDKTDKSNIKIAKQIADELQQRFGKPWSNETAPLRITEIEDGLGAYPPLDDNPIPSGNALALKLLNALAQMNGKPMRQKQSLVLASTLSGHALSNPQMRGVLVNAVNSTNNGNTGFVRNTAKGNVKVALKLNRATNQASLKINIKPGWHINSNKPLEDYLIPTEIKLDDNNLTQENYPKAQVKALAFNKEKLSLYEGKLNINIALPKANKRTSHKLTLNLQACSDKICLQPENLEFHFWQ